MAAPTIVLRHWTKGGTGLTNFDPSERPLYEAAIKKHGDPAFALSDQPFGDYVIPGDHSLHHFERKDTGPFWRVFERLRDQAAVAAV